MKTGARLLIKSIKLVKLIKFKLQKQIKICKLKYHYISIKIKRFEGIVCYQTINYIICFEQFADVITN